MFIVPIGDVNDEGKTHTSFVNWGIIWACIGIFAYELYLNGQGDEQVAAFFKTWMYDPKTELGEGFLALSTFDRIGVIIGELCNLTKGTFVKLAAASLLHGGIMHVLPNMFALWMLGDNVEYVMGHVRYFIFFMLTAVLASCGQMVFATPENFNGIIGASGAIFAIGAAYLVYFPGAKINFFYIFFIFFWGVKAFSARWVIILYFLLQLGSSMIDYGSDYGKVAVWAHVWGFVSGFLLCFWFRKDVPEEQRDYQPMPSKASYIRTPFSPPRPTSGGWGKPDAATPTAPWGERPADTAQKTDSKFAGRKNNRT